MGLLDQILAVIRKSNVKKERKPMALQTLIFDKDKFSKEDAQKWAAAHGFNTEVDETEESFRLRQKNPDHFKSMRTIELTPGVKGVVGKCMTVQKSLPSSSSVHVNKPIGEDNKIKKEFPEESNKSQAFARTDTEANTMAGLYDMQQIVSGMDYELTYHTQDEDEATQTAIQNLMDDPDYYRKRYLEQDGTDFPDQRVEGNDRSGTIQKDAWPNTGQSVEGFSLDLGSGDKRQPGHLGLDLYPHDNGTIVHDLNLGIPFPSGTAQKVHMENSLHDMDNLKDDPAPLMNEVHRVLRPGGSFVYVGPERLPEDVIPEGLIPVWDEGKGESDTWGEQNLIEKLSGTPMGVRQEFLKVNPDPATSNDAEPRVGIEPWDALPADAILAATALDYAWSDATTSAMGNKLHGYPSQGALVTKQADQNEVRVVPIVKADRMKQIVYCVVLEPDFEDEQEDIMTAEEIENTAHAYLEQSRVIGTSHTGPIDAVPVESYIAPADIEIKDGIYGAQVIKKGSWVIGIKIQDPKEWAKVLEGEYHGVSVGGVGLRQTVS